MRAKEAIPILAEAWGVPMETAWVLDRSLADAGLRQKVKGRNPPHMTLREGVHFLLACMTYRVATKAAEDVAYWSQFSCRLSDPDTEAFGSHEEAETNVMLAALAHRPDAAMALTGEDHVKTFPMGYRDDVIMPLRPLADENGCVGLVDYLTVLARWMVSIGAPSPSDVKFEIVVSHDLVMIEIRDTFGREQHTDYFFLPTGAQGRVEDGGAGLITRTICVYGDALMDLPARTEGLERRQ